MKILLGCECSGVVRSEFRKLGHDAWSCDIMPADDGSEYHIQADILRGVLTYGWDMAIFFPPCTRLANSGRRWLHNPPNDKTMVQMWTEFFEGVELYKAVRNAPIPKIAIENPVMHDHARELIEKGKRHIVQPWWFGDKAFKATGFELIGLPKLKPTNKLTPPKTGTEEYKAWSWIHRLPPSPERTKLRSQTFPGIAKAMTQWG